MKFVSEKYPQLYVHDLGVRFVDGVAEVSDKATQDALKKVDGVRAAGGRPAKDAKDPGPDGGAGTDGDGGK